MRAVPTFYLPDDHVLPRYLLMKLGERARLFYTPRVRSRARVFYPPSRMRREWPWYLASVVLGAVVGLLYAAAKIR